MVLGELIRQVFLDRGMKVTAFADKTGLARQSVYRLFRRDSVDTELLARISTVLEYDFFQHFSWNPVLRQSHFQVDASAVRRVEDRKEGMLQRQLEAGRERIQLLEDRIADKERIIELLKEGA